jgi:hypothetical protein
MWRNKTSVREPSGQPISAELTAVLVAVADGRQFAMTVDDGRALPSGPFEVDHRSLQFRPYTKGFAG